MVKDRDHVFEGEGDYCEHWASHQIGQQLTFSSQCGYLRETHPEESR